MLPSTAARKTQSVGESYGRRGGSGHGRSQGSLCGGDTTVLLISYYQICQIWPVIAVAVALANALTVSPGDSVSACQNVVRGVFCAAATCGRGLLPRQAVASPQRATHVEARRGGGSILVGGKVNSPRGKCEGIQRSNSFLYCTYLLYGFSCFLLLQIGCTCCFSGSCT